MNPILRKEMRSLLRERRGWLVPGLYGALLAGIVAVVCQTTAYAVIDPQRMAVEAAMVVAVLQTIVVALIAPILGAASIASERERGTWTRLLAAPIARSQIAVGKLAATGMYIVVLLLVPLPVAALTVLFGGMDMASLSGLCTTHLLLGITLGCVGLAVSTAFHRTWVATAVAIALVATLTVTAELPALTLRTSAETPMWIALLESLSPIRGTELFFRGDEIEHARRFWAMHFGALAALAAGAVAFATVRIRSMTE
jgi:ABC-type transport system involved in multi-copper enzyme maturation permease subunit